MDDYRIDSHKLMYHIDRLNKWLKGRDIYPIYIEISPYGGCNHRCIFCALDFLGYKPLSLERAKLMQFLRDIAKKGVKSIMFAGEGEPLLHKDIAELIIYAKNRGLNVAITTNGVFLSNSFLKKTLKCLSWLRVSFNAPQAQLYSYIHNTKKEDFYIVVKNIKEAVKIKRHYNYDCTIGIQFLLLEENFKQVFKMVNLAKSIDVDYLVIKPYSLHPKSHNRLKVNYKNFLFLKDKLAKYENKKFKIIFRENAMLRMYEKKPYGKCLGLPFWSYLSSSGDLYACSTFLGNKDFLYGNIYKQRFEQIWKGNKKEKIMRRMENSWDIKNCRQACRLDEINHFLWNVKNPLPHLNFI